MINGNRTRWKRRKEDSKIFTAAILCAAVLAILGIAFIFGCGVLLGIALAA